MKPAVAVTIDVEYGDRPHGRPDHLRSIMAVVRRFAVPVTLFVEGRWASAHPAELHDAVALAPEGTVVGLHGYSHVAFDRLSDEGIELEVTQCIAAVAAVADPAPLLRLPYGRGWDRPEVRAVTTRLGIEVVGWDVGTLDWNTDVPLAHAVGLADDLWQTGGVLLFHQWPNRSARLLTEVLGRGVAAGVRFTSVAPGALVRETPTGLVPGRGASPTPVSARVPVPACHGRCDRWTGERCAPNRTS